MRNVSELKGSDPRKEINSESSKILHYNFGNQFIKLDPKIAMAGLILSRYHYEAGTISMSDFSNLIINEIGLNIKPFTELLFHLADGYETIMKSGDNNDTVDASLIKAGDHSNLSQESCKEILKSVLGVEYQDLYDTEVVIQEVIDEAIDDPEFMSYYSNALHTGDKEIFSSLRRLAEDNPEEFVNFPFDRKLIAVDIPQEPLTEQIDEEHFIAWLSFYTILQAILKGSDPYQEVLYLKAQMMERRETREAIMKRSNQITISPQKKVMHPFPL